MLNNHLNILANSTFFCPTKSLLYCFALKGIDYVLFDSLQRHKIRSNCRVGYSLRTGIRDKYIHAPLVKATNTTFNELYSALSSYASVQTLLWLVYIALIFNIII